MRLAVTEWTGNGGRKDINEHKKVVLLETAAG